MQQRIDDTRAEEEVKAIEANGEGMYWGYSEDMMGASKIIIQLDIGSPWGGYHNGLCIAGIAYENNPVNTCAYIYYYPT